MRWTRKAICSLAAASLLILSAAGPPPAAAANAAHRRIESALASGTIAQTQWAVKRIAKLLQAPDHYSVPYQLQYNWLPTLLRRRDYPAVAALAEVDILHNPGLTENIDAVLADRIRALLAMEKPNAALRNAKSLFNVCTLADTRQVLLLVRQAVGRVYHGHPRIMQAFISQQITGSGIPADEHEPIIRCGVLAAVVVHGRRYEQKLKLLHGGGNWTLLEKGNLELLTDHPRTALANFRQLAAMAGNAKDFLNDENDICRAIKAEDGTIGRANAHLLSAVKSVKHGFH
jgi:hypothetical protein